MSASFEAYGPAHLTAIALLPVGAVAIVMVGRRLRGSSQQLQFSRGFAVLIAVLTVPMQAAQFLESDFDAATTLPIQLCDLAWLASMVALWTWHRFPTALIYYWGLPLTTQALLTPALAEGFPHPRFFTFFAVHLMTVWAACYLTWGVGIRPTWSIYRVTVLTTAGWAVAVYLLNLAIGTNFGYLNRKPSAASILDLFGPWPVYVLVEIAIIAVLWALMTWPWERSAVRTRPRASGRR